MERIDVLIPVYNREDTISECLTSILQQTYKNLRIVVYDDGSTDKSEHIIKKFKDERIVYIKSEKNEGVAVARAKMLGMIESKYVAFQDSDDMSNIYRIELQYNRIIKEENAFISTKQCRLKPKLRNQCFITPVIDPNDNGGCFASILFKADNYPKFADGVNMGGVDALWLIELRDCMKVREIILPERLYYINFNPINRIGRQKKEPINKEIRRLSSQAFHRYLYGLEEKYKVHLVSRRPT